MKPCVCGCEYGFKHDEERMLTIIRLRRENAVTMWKIREMVR